jgi:dihydroorotase
MPKHKPPLIQVPDILAYRTRILAQLPSGTSFEPLMTLYLTDDTSPSDIAKAHAAGILAAKLYPAGATTHSQSGVRDIPRLYPTFAEMEKQGMRLLIHGEVTDPSVDIFDREAVFIDRYLIPIRQSFPQLPIVLEHITTKEAAQYVAAQEARYTAATLTAHHLLYNRNALFEGGLRPHAYCLPVLKREGHRQALIQAATSGLAAFFLGTDSAPHSIALKEAEACCAGCYTAPTALAMYATVFEEAGALAHLANFAGVYGPRFYGLEPDSRQIRLVKNEQAPQLIPEDYPLGEDHIRLKPLWAGQSTAWQIAR